MRLSRYLAHCGVASRRAAERLIADRRVSIDGVVVTDPARDVDAASGVAFDGRPVLPEPRETWIVNKPLDVTSTAREPGRRRAVADLVTSDRRLYPVGRLDADSTGLILLTNDGELANRLTHPRYRVPKAYRAVLRRPIGARELARLRSGVELDDGPTAPSEVDRIGPREIEITIREGRNRQVRRMVEAVGNRVSALERVRFGSLVLGDLPPGAVRRLSRSELRRLWKDAGR
ncbi:MAG: rRNA pseudouridine synthase [Thermoleophilia bacterium]|nr:rRNA pseudouridine synthase [Thermoleophilia bacterium]